MDQPTTDSFIDLESSVSVSDAKSAAWVFGYGSLCWNPGFRFKKAVIGNIRGYSRKFWQGNNTHRGTDDKPGRVATLVKDDKESVVNGVAFQIIDEVALEYLDKRECSLGGYIAEFTTFKPAEGGPMLTVILYIATSENALWLGDAPLGDIADQITYCSGNSGYNAEYLLRLANFMRLHFPGHYDEHLFELEALVNMNIRNDNLCYKTLMGCGKNVITFVKVEPVLDNAMVDNQNERDRDNRFQFTTRMPDKTLRCLNI